MNEKFLEWLEKKRQFDMELQAEKGEGWDAEDEDAYNDLKYYLSTLKPTAEEEDKGTELMRLEDLPWVALGDSKRIELLRTCVRLLALAVSSGAQYFLQQVVEKLDICNPKDAKIT
jgi:hypothetical protein